MTDASVQPTIKVLLVEHDTRLAQLTARYLESHGVAKLKWPERLEIIAEMPMTPTRKIIKGLL